VARVHFGAEPREGQLPRCHDFIEKGRDQCQHSILDPGGREEWMNPGDIAD